MFGEISVYGLNENLKETRAFIIHNDSGGAYTNLNIWIDKVVGALGTYEISAVALTPDANNEVFMEKIDNIRATPFTASFVEADTVSNKQLLSASFANDGYIGIWVRRLLTSEDSGQYDCDVLYANHTADPQVKLVTDSGIDITLEWD